MHYENLIICIISSTYWEYPSTIAWSLRHREPEEIKEIIKKKPHTHIQKQNKTKKAQGIRELFGNQTWRLYQKGAKTTKRKHLKKLDYNS